MKTSNALTVLVSTALLGLLLINPGVVRAEGSEESLASTETVALGWVEALNSGDVEAMGRFREAHVSGGGSGDWRELFRRLRSELGRLEVEKIRVGDGEVDLLVASEHAQTVLLSFEFTGGDAQAGPPRIAGLRIRDAGEALAADLPPLALSEAKWRDQVDAYVEALAEQDRFSGTVLVLRRGEKLFEGAYGLASREFRVPNTMATRFDVGSFNKDYTRLCVLKLVVAGKVRLEDPVGRHLPDFPNPEIREKVTIGQLLEHRGGVADYFTEEYGETPMNRLREIADYLPIWGPKALLFEPGSREEYSNFGYTILGAVLEAHYGMPYSEIVEKHVFAPAGMKDSGFFETDAIVPDVAVGYTRMGPDGPGEELRKNIYLEPVKGGPWGKSYSTAEDLYRFFDAMFAGRLLPEEHNWLRRGWDSSIALAGGGPGLNAVLWLEDGLMVIVMANLDMPIAEDLGRRLHEAIREAGGAG